MATIFGLFLLILLLQLIGGKKFIAFEGAIRSTVNIVTRLIITVAVVLLIRLLILYYSH